MTTLAPDGVIYLSDEELAVASPDERRRYAAYLTRQMHRVDPVAWGREVLKETWWSKQREIATSVVNNRRTAVRSCHDSGKSFIAARIACWWLSTGSPGKRFVVSTAPSGDQVKAILWREINQAHRKGNLPGRTNLTEWHINGEIVGLGRKPNDYDTSSFQGVHAAEGVLVIYDEAGGIPAELFQAGQSMAANAVSRELAIGNPDDPNSHFSTLFRPDSTWSQVHISAFSTPFFTGEDVPKAVMASLVDDIYVNEIERDYGVDSPLYVAKVLGDFPEDSADGVVPYSWLNECREGYAGNLTDDVGPDQDISLGVDVGAGGDQTVIVERIGMKVGRTWRYRHDDAMKSVGEIVGIIRLTGAARCKVDVIGIGFGVHGRLKEVCDSDYEIDCDVVAVNVGSAAHDPRRFTNLKAEIWWEVARELSRTKAWDLSEIDNQTVAELVAHRYSNDSAGRIKVESKDAVRERLKRSPDTADALLLAFYEPPSHTPMLLGVA